MIRVIVLMTLMPDARPGDVIAALAGDLALVPWARPWRPASARAAGDWRNALGPVPLEELRDLVLGSAWREHRERGCPGAVTAGKKRPLRAGSLDGTLLRSSRRPGKSCPGCRTGWSPTPGRARSPLIWEEGLGHR